MKKAALLPNLSSSSSYFRASSWAHFKFTSLLKRNSKKSSNIEIRLWKKPSALLALPFLCLAMASLLEWNQESEDQSMIPAHWLKVEISLPCAHLETGFYEAYGSDQSQEFFHSSKGEIFAPPSFSLAENMSCFPISKPQQIEEIL